MMSTSKHQVTVPDGLTSPQAKLIYLALQAQEEATVTDLQQMLRMPKLTLLPILTSLVENELIQRTEAGYAS
ncbi:MarR family transcriptional regulator [Natrinema amylolyticum]|uniref:MarR family transcriptional regulator n=1 Tax=Natrinema amylolyticum TaxID=2878679 RepID=UPI001CF9379B|nr:MarR family transcriptional regulator [Natrinema amylolyticum]